MLKENLNRVEYKFLRDLKTIDWSCFLNFTDLDNIYEVFNSNVKTVVEKHDLFVTYKIESKLEAWVTDDFFQVIAKRNFLKKQANKTKSINDLNNFTQKRNQNNMKR